MGRVTWRGVVRHPVRFILSVLAVVLGIAFVSGTFSLRALMSDTFTEIIDQSLTADIYVQGPKLEQGSNSGTEQQIIPRQLVPITLSDTIAAVPTVASALPEISGSAVLVGADGAAVSTGQAPAFGSWIDEQSDDTLTEGAWATKTGEVALEASTLERSGLSIGDTTTVIVQGEITQQKVTGVFTVGGEMAGATLVGFDRDTAEQVFAPEGLVPSIVVMLDPGTDVTTAVQKIEQALPSGSTAEVITGEQVRADNKAELTKQLGVVQTFLLVFALISLLVGGFLIFNTFQMVVRQRLREIAVLRAIGASPNQVAGSILGQAVIVGVLGSLIGIAAGLGLVTAIKAVLAATGTALSGDVPLTVSGVVWSLIFGIVTSLVSALVPALMAARVPPADAMRDQLPTKTYVVRRWGIVGGVLLISGVVAVGMAVAGVGRAGLVLGVGAGLVLFGVLALLPALADPITHVLVWPLRWLRPMARLGRSNVARNPVRTAITSGALTISMALIGAVSVLAASFQASVVDMVESSLTADFIMEGAVREVPAGALDAARDVDGVRRVDEVALASMMVSDQPVSVASLPPASFEDAVRLDVVAGTSDSYTSGQALVAEQYAKANNVSVGDSLTLTNPMVPDARATVTVGGVFKTAFTASIVAPPATFDALIPASDRLVVSSYILLEPGADPDQVKADLIAATEPFLVVSVTNKEEYVTQIANQVQQLVAILYALLGMSIVVAFVGVTNTLALSVMERTREIGLMRAVGLGKLQLATTITVESVLVAAFGTVVGLIVGVALASAMPSIYADQGLTELSIPWGSLTGAVIFAGVVGALAALIPAIRAASLPVLDAVSHD